ncbi:MAG: S-adenosylmethionine:tRNA ribosyltransferase-isomerase [Muribaculaceae bacterium]|nr:S-adenosylmethionine:tRNA ribosyltransferase-isomerase [Muribaculaceae bacterium]
MKPQEIAIEKFDYPLPDSRIASHPLEARDRCKLLVCRPDGAIEDRVFCELPQLLPESAMLVYNNTRVINARLRFAKESGAMIEIFCLEPIRPVDYAVNFASQGAEGVSWLCFVGNSKRWKSGALKGVVTLPSGEEIILSAERVEKQGNASVVAFSWTGTSTFAEVIAAAGELPIPPYLNRPTEQADLKDYQTVFSAIDGSVAAPTAGLHFTPELLEELDKAGVQRRSLTLHVGAGTFQPVKSDLIGDHPMHSEFISVSRELIEELSRTKRSVYAVGTTSVRTLESLYHLGCRAAVGLPTDELPQWYPYSEEHPQLTVREAMEALLKAFQGPQYVASTRVIIAPGYEYRVVDGIITNFHQPRSTLLLLVSAFLGGERWRDVYAHALSDPDYRFLSYGDACLLTR